MTSDETEKAKIKKGKNHILRGSLDLYFYENVGSRYYLRITPFAIILIIIALVIGFTILWMDSRKQSTPNINLDIPTATPHSSQGVSIQQHLSPSPAKAVRQPKAALPPAVPSPVKGTNEP